MKLKSFLKTLSPVEASEFAARCHTSIGHLRNVASGFRPCATDLAVCIERESGRHVTRQELRTDWARHWPELADAAAVIHGAA